MSIVKVITFISVLLLGSVSVLLAQIPNSGFESWSGGEPAGWATNNGGPILVVTQSSDAHSGSSAAQGTVYDAGFGFTIGATLDTKSNGTTGFPISQRYSSLSLYYKFTSDSGDAFTVQVGMLRGGIPIGVGTFSDTTSTSSYKQVSFTITYDSTSTPDTAVIAISISPLTGCHANSKFVVDDLSFGTATAVTDRNQLIPEQFALLQNFPNPFNPNSWISYSLPRSSSVRLTVYDVLGRTVATLVDRVQAAGTHRERVDGTKLGSGMYFYRLEATATGNTADRFAAVKKMIVLK